MMKLRKTLHPYLKAIHTSTYYQRADGMQMPYLVYSLEVTDWGEGHQRVTLDIDGWDKPTDGDTTQIETLMTLLNAAMDKKTFVTDEFAVTFYLDRKLALEDDDPDIRRRKYIYRGRLQERGE